MSKGVKTVLGVAAAVAIPFVAPAIAGVLGVGAIGSALIGAGLGAGAGAFTGGGRGALLGAAGGGIGGYGGFSSGLGNLFGGTGGATGGLFGAGAGAPTALPGAAAATPVGGLLTGATPAGLGAVAPGVAATTAPAAGLATGGVSSTILNLGKQLAGGVSVPGLANLAMTMFNKPQEGLTPAEQAALIETAQLAQTNQNLFNQRVSEAQKLINMGTPNPEQAFAEAQGRVERGYREAERTAALRGVSTPESRLSGERRAAIAGTREGTLAVNRDYERAAKIRQMGVAAMPTEAPAGPAYAGLMFAGLPEKRQQTYQQETSRAVGGLFGPATEGGPLTLKSMFG
jgi:hypothetical protein